MAGFVNSKDLKNSEILSISKKMTTLEMKELNGRQRAEHAVRMYDMQKQQLRDIEDRNFELEQKFSEVSIIKASKPHRQFYSFAIDLVCGKFYKISRPCVELLYILIGQVF